jgi:thymidylate synthase
MSEVDEVYRDIVENVLKNGQYKPNRTGVDTISKFGVNYTIDNSEGFPLLTTKKMDGYRWDSMLHELLWYLSGEEHVSELKKHTGIWDEWSDEDDMLESAYGRFWRRYPYPDRGFKGEAWADPLDNENVQYEGNQSCQFTFDQLGHVIDNIQENPNSRRHVVTAWHPVNAAVSKLPPCHLMFIFNVQDGDTLNLHLTQRSGDIALGIPFNIACYSLLQRMVAQETGLKVGNFNHTIVDAHVYCGEGERGEWYQDNWKDVSEVANVPYYVDKGELDDFDLPDDPNNYDHVPGLCEQMTREPYDSPNIEIDDKPIDELEYDDFTLQDYESHDGIKFGVAE